MAQRIIKKYTRLRWRFDYANGSRFGLWDGIGESIQYRASCQPPNQLKVFIEATDRTGAIYPACEVDGRDFRRFEWHAYAIVSNALAMQGAVKIPPKIYAASIVTASQRVTIYVDGTHKLTDLTDSEKALLV
jgi:hypothetical protein